MVEIINKITPNEDELKKFNQFAKEKKSPSSLAENDRFLFSVSVVVNAGWASVGKFIKS